MSSAFVTILRDKLIEITEKFRDEDEMRILRVLLSDTNMEKSKFKEQTQNQSNEIQDHHREML